MNIYTKTPCFYPIKTVTNITERSQLNTHYELAINASTRLIIIILNVNKNKTNGNAK